MRAPPQATPRRTGLVIMGRPEVQSTGETAWTDEVQCMQEYNPTAIAMLLGLVVLGFSVVVTLLASRLWEPSRDARLNRKLQPAHGPA